MSKKEVFEANLKTECDLWHLMVKEMWAGKKLADEHKVWGLGCRFALTRAVKPGDSGLARAQDGLNQTRLISRH